MKTLKPIHELDPTRFDSSVILKAVVSASRKLAELKGVVATIPNQAILINTLTIQEAKDSSAIENIITTFDEIYREGELIQFDNDNTAAKEVKRYGAALLKGYASVKKNGTLSLNSVLEIQAKIEPKRPGLRMLPGTVLKNAFGETVYTPPQDAREVQRLIGELEKFWHDEPLYDVDPLVRMALIHHQFESIHPFYDGNGRTGRVVNVLYLVLQGLLDLPVLYLSKYIQKNRSEYYRLLNSVREQDTWEEWVLYMIAGVEDTASDAITKIAQIRDLLQIMKEQIRSDHKFYSQDLVNNLFSHPYTKIEYIMRDLDISRITATKYLNTLVTSGVLNKIKAGRDIYYINHALFKVLTAP